MSRREIHEILKNLNKEEEDTATEQLKEKLEFGSDSDLARSLNNKKALEIIRNDESLTVRLENILYGYSDRDLLNFCLVNKANNEFCENNHYFWEQRFRKTFGVLPKPKNMTWRRFYLNTIKESQL